MNLDAAKHKAGNLVTGITLAIEVLALEFGRAIIAEVEDISRLSFELRRVRDGIETQRKTLRDFIEEVEGF